MRPFGTGYYTQHSVLSVTSGNRVRWLSFACRPLSWGGSMGLSSDCGAATCGGGPWSLQLPLWPCSIQGVGSFGDCPGPESEGGDLRLPRPHDQAC
jgi:hypothetical protein